MNLKSRAAFLAVLTAAAGATLSGCSSSQLSADSSCQDYLNADSATRQDAAIRITSQLHTEDPGNPLWGMQLDASCGAAPSATIRQVLGK